MATKPRRAMTIIHSWDDVPEFESEAEESAFWASHELDDVLLGQMSSEVDQTLPPPRPRTKPIALRFDEDTIRRAKTLASRRGKGYQTLLKEFVSERLYEEEKREGLIGAGAGDVTGAEHRPVRSPARTKSRPSPARKPSEKSDQRP